LDSRLPLDPKAYVLMVLLCLLWSLQQIVLKAVAADIPPTLHIALRSSGAAVLVAALMVWRGERFDWRAWRPGLAAGTLFALEFVMVGQSLVHTSASHTVVFLYTAPLFAALGLHWKVPAERLNGLQWVGIGLAFSGVVTAFLGKDSPSPATGVTSLLGDFLALLGGAAWGATTVVIRTTALSRTSATQTLLFQLLGAGLILLAFAYATDTAWLHPTPAVIGSLVFQTVVVAFASFLAWFWLLRTYLASRLGVFTFLTPLSGVALGVLLLNEPLEPRFVVGAALVLSGILVVSAHTSLRGFAARFR